MVIKRQQEKLNTENLSEEEAKYLEQLLQIFNIGEDTLGSQTLDPKIQILDYLITSMSRRYIIQLYLQHPVGDQDQIELSRLAKTIEVPTQSSDFEKARSKQVEFGVEWLRNQFVKALNNRSIVKPDSLGNISSYLIPEGRLNELKFLTLVEYEEVSKKSKPSLPSYYNPVLKSQEEQDVDE